MTWQHRLRWRREVPPVAKAPAQYCHIKTVRYHDGKVVTAHECEGSDVNELSTHGAKVITETGHWTEREG